MQRLHRRLQTAARKEGQYRQHAPVDRPRCDLVAGAGVEGDARIGEHRELELALGEQEHIARGGPEQVGLSFGALRMQRRIELFPVREHRPRIDRACVARGLNREAQMAVFRRVWHEHVTEHRALGDERSTPQRQRHARSPWPAWTW